MYEEYGLGVPTKVFVSHKHVDRKWMLCPLTLETLEGLSPSMPTVPGLLA
jgi:hypothetical protein